MKIFKSFVLLLIVTFSIGSCQKDKTATSSVPANLHELPLSGAKVGYDGTVYNHEQYGKFVYQHVKYYNGTVDPYSYMPTEARAEFKRNFEAYQAKISGWSYAQIVDDLVQQKIYTAQQAVIFKKDFTDLKDYLLSNHPTQKEAWDYCLAKEQQIIDNRQLSKDEKDVILAQKSGIRYALKLHIEQDELNSNSQNNWNSNTVSSRGACTSQEKTSCWLNSIFGFTTGGGGGGATIAGLIKGASVKTYTIWGAVIGLVIGIVNGAISCTCDNVSVTICDAPVAAGLPYICYVSGNSITASLVGSSLPDQFVGVIYDGSTGSQISNPIVSNTKSITIPGSYLSNVSSIKIQVNAHCPGTATQAQQSISSPFFGPYVLSDLGKTFFAIDGNSSIGVNSNQLYPQYYTTYGVFNANAQYSWEIIPSGYPNYSATGSIVGGGNWGSATVSWDPHPGFATVKCTVSANNCANVVQYFSVQIF